MRPVLQAAQLTIRHPVWPLPALREKALAVDALFLQQTSEPPALLAGQAAGGGDFSSLRGERNPTSRLLKKSREEA
jgi:hypothetical protein